MKRIFGTLGLLLMLAASGSAQAAPVASWTMDTTAPSSLATVSGYAYTLKVDTDQPFALVPACVATTAVQATCTAPISQALVTRVSTGQHTVALSASNAFGSSGSSITGSLPGAPGGLRLTITVSIGGN